MQATHYFLISYINDCGKIYTLFDFETSLKYIKCVISIWQRMSLDKHEKTTNTICRSRYLLVLISEQQ